MKRRRHLPDKGDPNQLRIDWGISGGEPRVPPPPPLPAVMEIAIKESVTAAPVAIRPVAVKTPRVRRPAARPTGEFVNRIIARLPVPHPVTRAVTAGRFGIDEEGQPIRPAADEVRAITESAADKLIDMLDAMTPRPGHPAIADTLPEAFGDLIAAYAQDFGDRAARQLEAYARRQASLDESDRPHPGMCR